MEKDLLKLLACPACLGELDLVITNSNDNDIIDGLLICPKCKLQFYIVHGVAVLGIDSHYSSDRTSEMHGENEWMITSNQIEDHIDFARESAIEGEKLIHKFISKLDEKAIKNVRVLDLGAGLGCLQSWQFSKYGFKACAVDICPEFMMASDVVAKSSKIDRLVSDCTLLPFKNNSFDIIFCKELIHHVNPPLKLFDEIWRIAKSDSYIIVREPCVSVLISKKLYEKVDSAKRAGLTHQYYNYFNYVSLVKTICDDIDMSDELPIIGKSNHPVMHIIQKPLILLSKISLFKHIVLKTQLILLYGSVNIIGKKKNSYVPKPTDRAVTPINVKDVNNKQIEFYNNVLVPNLFDVFKKTKY